MCNNGTDDLELKKVYGRVPPSEDYYAKVVLGLKDDTTWENMGGLRWELVLCLLGKNFWKDETESVFTWSAGGVKMELIWFSFFSELYFLGILVL